MPNERLPSADQTVNPLIPIYVLMTENLEMGDFNLTNLGDFTSYAEFTIILDEVLCVIGGNAKEMYYDTYIGL